MAYDPGSILHVDYGPDTDEEKRIKAQLSELQDAYRKAAQPYLDRLVEIQMLKVPRILMYDRGALS